MLDKLKRAARSAAEAAFTASKEAPKYAKKARRTLEPYAKQYAAKAAQKLNTVQKETTRYVQSEKVAEKVAENVATTKNTLIKPTFKVMRKTRNWALVLGFGAIGVFGFSYGMSHALVGTIKETFKA